MTSSANVLTRARFKLIVFFLLAGLLVAALWPAFQSPGEPEDEGIALVYPARPRHFSHDRSVCIFPGRRPRRRPGTRSAFRSFARQTRAKVGRGCRKR